MLSLEFPLFAATLLGVATLHRHTLPVALTGLASVIAYKLAFTDFAVAAHFLHEAPGLMNLAGLLMGFALLADHFERSNVPALLPKFLPDDWRGGFILLWLTFILSAFLDNIAAAIIGSTVAASVFQRRLHVGYIAALVAAANAGGAGSVLGDTTTTMMWIAGKSPFAVLHAYIGAVVATVFAGVITSIAQQRYQPITIDPLGVIRIDRGQVAVVGLILASVIAANLMLNLYFKDVAGHVPGLALAVWAAILVGARLRPPRWDLIPEAARGAVFLTALVGCASLMPVDTLPEASWQTTFALGGVSALFDNIPLTALALRQGGFDWGLLAYAAGYGGSMIWFGSSAGVAVASRFPEARSVKAWVVQGWPVAVGYVLGFAALLGFWGWHPS